MANCPTTSVAQEWITPDIFIYHGSYYQIMPDSVIVKISKKTLDKSRNKE